MQTVEIRPRIGLRLVLPPGALRLLLATLVFLSHLSSFDIGTPAVVLFFVLSGYWTSKIYEAKFLPDRLGTYVLSRWLRVYPLFLIASVVFGLLQHSPLGARTFTLIGIASGGPDPTGVAWSLDIEAQFYLLLPVIVPLVRKFGLRAILATLPIAALGWLLSGHTGVSTVAGYLPMFEAGVLLHVRPLRPTDRTISRSLVGFFLMTGATALTPFMWKTAHQPFDHAIWDAVWMLPLLPYVAASVAKRSTPLDRHLGNLSFPLYLVHVPATNFARLLVEGVGAKLLAVVFAPVLALVFYVGVDRPIDRWRVRLTETRPTGRLAALARR